MAGCSSSNSPATIPTRNPSDFDSLSDEMKRMVNITLQNVVARTPQHFGMGSTYLRFNQNRKVSKEIKGINSTILCGSIMFAKKQDANKERTQTVSLPFMLKLTPQHMSYRDFHLYSFTNEMFFYTSMVPFFDRIRDTRDLFATYYNGQMQVNRDGLHAVIVMESLRNVGYRPPHKKSFLMYKYLHIMMEKLGMFHAYSYQAKKLMSSERVIFGETVGEFPGLVNMLADTYVGATLRMDHFLSKISTRGLMELEKDDRYKPHVPLIKRYIELADELVMRVLSGDRNLSCAVLCHGDYIATNTVFLNQDICSQSRPMNMRILDFTGCKFASPVVDLSLVLYMNANQGMRDRNWDLLINAYYKALTETFPDNKETIPTKEAILNEFIGKAPFAYFVASYFLPTLISIDNKMNVQQYLPKKYPNWNYSELPEKNRVKYCNRVGEQIATEALADILKDMQDRGFFTEEALQGLAK